jgi:hypothetical protein
MSRTPRRGRRRYQKSLANALPQGMLLVRCAQSGVGSGRVHIRMRPETQSDDQAANSQERDSSDRRRSTYRREDRSNPAPRGPGYRDRVPARGPDPAGGNQGDPLQRRGHAAVDHPDPGQSPHLDCRAPAVCPGWAWHRQRVRGGQCGRGPHHGRQRRAFRVPDPVCRSRGAKSAQALHPYQTAGRRGRGR